MTGAKTFSAATSFTDSTASTSISTGAVKVTGGIGAGGAINGQSSVSARDSTVQTAILANSGLSVGRIGTVSNHALQVIVNNAVVASFVSGIQIGSPTGGDKGAGTLNVSGDIYKNNTAYTNPDYVFEHAYTGKIEKFAENPGASSYNGRLSLDDLRVYTRKNLRLPGITDDAMGAFERSDFVLARIEELTLEVLDLHDRLKKLEGTKNN